MRIRVFYFFVYYVAGLKCDETTWRRIITFGERCTGGDSGRAASSKADDRMSRYMGCVGIFVTLLVCNVMREKDLDWTYKIRDYGFWNHALFIFQYVLAGTAMISVILVFKTIPFSLFPFGHASSTLAIYEWHWIIADFIHVGAMPFTYSWIFDSTVAKECFTKLPPVPAAVAMHAICYCICIFLGSRFMWNAGLRYVCDPEWLTRRLFHHYSDLKGEPDGSLRRPAVAIGENGSDKGAIVWWTFVKGILLQMSLWK